jgi:cell division transport system permease protein
LRDTLIGIRLNIVGIGMSILVIGFTLALPVGLHVLHKNFLSLTDNLGAVPEVSLFLEPTATRAMAEGIAGNLRKDKRVVRVEVIDRDVALAALTSDSALGVAAQSLEVNPLPYAVALEIERTAFEGAPGDSFQTELATLPGIEDAVFDVVWIRRLEAFSNLIARLALVIAVIIGAGVILIAGNTIRSGIHGRRDEIEVLKLCGATDTYVSRPFLYSGAIQGLLGAVVACTVVVAAIALVVPALDRVTAAYGTPLPWSNLSFDAVLTTLACGALMGWFGALFAVKVYLRRLDSALAV